MRTYTLLEAVPFFLFAAIGFIFTCAFINTAWKEHMNKKKRDTDCANRNSPDVTSAKCWHCKTEYDITSRYCPHCSHTNANIDPELAQLERHNRQHWSDQ